MDRRPDTKPYERIELSPTPVEALTAPTNKKPQEPFVSAPRRLSWCLRPQARTCPWGFLLVSARRRLAKAAAHVKPQIQSMIRGAMEAKQTAATQNQRQNLIASSRSAGTPAN